MLKASIGLVGEANNPASINVAVDRIICIKRRNKKLLF